VSDSKPIKIVRIISRLNIGGPAIHVVHLTEQLGPPNYDSLLVYGQTEPDEKQMDQLFDQHQLQALHLPSLRRPIHPIRDLKALKQLIEIISREQPDIVHTHASKAGFLGRLAARWVSRKQSRPIRTVHTYHGHVLSGYFHPLKEKLFLSLERFLSRKTDRLIAVSPKIQNDLIDLDIGHASQWTIVPLGFDLEPFLNLKSPLTANENLRVGTVGRLTPIKNYPFLLQVIQACQSESSMKTIAFELVGDGSCREALQETARQLGLKPPPHFSGWETDMPQTYNRFDIVCLTSINEGTPVSLIEGLAAGRPVISTDVGGVGDLMGEIVEQHKRFTRYQHGLLVQLDDTQAYKDGLQYLYGHPEERIRMGLAGRSFVAKRFTKDRLIRDIQSLYQELLT